MRRLSPLFLLAALPPAFVVAPVVALPSAAPTPRPVAPKIQEIDLVGVDEGSLDELATTPPAAEEHAEEGTEGHAQASPSARRARPFVLTRRLDTSQYSALGVTWRPEAGLDEVTVEVRTRTKGAGWSDWEEAEVELNAVPDPGTAEAADPDLRSGTNPLWVGKSDGVQVRVDAPGEKPDDLELALIDPGTSEADAAAADPQAGAPAASAAAAVARPTIRDRAAWGADESLRSGSPSYMSTIKAGIVHHTATGNTYSAAEVPAILRSMYAYHTRTNGWSDLGYNFVVDKYGTLWEGRAGGVDRAVLGTHTGGFNTSTFGVSLIGNYDTATPPSAAVSTIERVLAWKLSLYGRTATGTTELTSGGSSYTTYPYGTRVQANVVSGHRDYSTKSCPGDRLYPLLPQMRTRTAALMAPVTATRLSVAAAPAALYYGRPATVSGQLTTSSAAAVGGKPVTVESRPVNGTTWRAVGTATTAADGRWTLANTPENSVVYRARFAGDDAYTASSSAEASVMVRPAVVTSLSASSIRLGATVTMRGTVKPAHAGQTVERQSYYAGAWRTVGTAVLGADGSFSWTLKPTTRGTHQLRVYKPADADHGPTYGAVQNLTVS